MTAISLEERQLRFVRIRQKFPGRKLENIQERLGNELRVLSGYIKKDMDIAIAVGSRGIAHIDLIVSEVVRFIQNNGANPFIIPAMGSHGGATADGQKKILSGLGITEEKVGAPVRATMDLVNLSDHPSMPLFIDRYGYSSDGIILVNRIKQHTDFRGEFESGLVKMSVVGLGKDKQAEFIHGKGTGGLERTMPEMARRLLGSGKIIAGIGIVEDANDDTMEIKVIPADQIMEKEKELLSLARQNRPCLPFNYMDVLIVDQIGKDINGVGMDPQIIGRMRIPGMPEPDLPKIRSIIACSLTEGSGGNGLGIGLADVITHTLFNQLDLNVIYRNVYTSTYLERAKIPIIAENELRALEFALRNCGEVLPGKEIIVRIKDTLHIGEMLVSIPALEWIRDKREIEIISHPMDIFNQNGTILPF